MVKLDRVLFARIFFYTRLGWGSYIAWWLGAIAYVTIIYELVLVKFIPDTLTVTVAILLGLMFLSGILGYTMKKLRIFGEEHAINAETNPYINKPIGFKEIANYEMRVQSYDVQIQNYGIQAQNLEMRLQEYEMRVQNIEIEMLNMKAIMELKISKATKNRLAKKLVVLEEQIHTLKNFQSFIRDQIRIVQDQRKIAVEQRRVVNSILSSADDKQKNPAKTMQQSSVLKE
ncbi:MAG: hypothetical protein M1156_02110 [Candidatus Marsarchaeota archaeon]|nr:hypothetical protein [Candidatus Marsarchaeota archaeon]